MTTAEATHMPPSAGVAADPNKHPLETAWCFWLRLKENNQSSSRDWQQQHVRAHTFSTVEDFWCMVNHINNPFDTTHVDYSIFREGLTPDYDVEPFKEGGRIMIELNSGARGASPAKQFDVWIHLLLALIGENFDEMGGEHVGGLRLVTKQRGGTKFEIWTKSTDESIMHQLSQAILDLVAPLMEPRDRSMLRARFRAFHGNRDAFEVSCSA